MKIYFKLFVGALISYLRYLCLFAYSDIQHMLCCVTTSFVPYVTRFSGWTIFDCQHRYSLTFIFKIVNEIFVASLDLVNKDCTSKGKNSVNIPKGLTKSVNQRSTMVKRNRTSRHTMTHKTINRKLKIDLLLADYPFYIAELISE